MTEYRGSFTVVVTPFREGDEAFDEDAMRRFVDWQIAEGAYGLITLGSMGEFFLVDDDERGRIISAVVGQAAGRVPVFAGAANARTEKAVRFSREAEKLGADGIMVLPPLYIAPTDAEIVAYFRRIAEAVSIPIMIYNNPTNANVDIPADVVARLADEFNNIRYIKEARGELARVAEIRRLAGEKMHVWQVHRASDRGAHRRHRGGVRNSGRHQQPGHVVGMPVPPRNRRTRLRVRTPSGGALMGRVRPRAPDRRIGPS